MNSQLLKFLMEHHTDDHSYIKVDDVDFVLTETVKRIDEHQSTDIDIEVSKLLESDLMEDLARALVMRENSDSLLSLIELEILAEVNLKELINNLLRAM